MPRLWGKDPRHPAPGGQKRIAPNPAPPPAARQIPTKHRLTGLTQPRPSNFFFPNPGLGLPCTTARLRDRAWGRPMSRKRHYGIRGTDSRNSRISTIDAIDQKADAARRFRSGGSLSLKRQNRSGHRVRSLDRQLASTLQFHRPGLPSVARCFSSLVLLGSSIASTDWMYSATYSGGKPCSLPPARTKSLYQP
jgi:hypothetical protein